MMEAEREARWARQHGVQLPADNHNNNKNGNGNSSRAFPSSLYYSAGPTAPSVNGGGGSDGGLTHPLLRKDHLSSVREGEEGEEEEDGKDGEIKDAEV